jgi:hypothetical protein
MAFQISDFTTRLTGDGARPNLFQVSIPNIPTALNAPSANPAASNPATSLSFLAKSAQLPGSTLGTVPMYYFGREVKFAGNRTFADWTITIVNDENFLIRNSIEVWMNYINSNQGNIRGTNVQNNNFNTTQALGYTSDAHVYQYAKTGGQDGIAGAIKAYDFVGLFPVDLSPIDLDWGSNDTIEEFSVTFAYQYWTSTNTTATTS